MSGTTTQTSTTLETVRGLEWCAGAIKAARAALAEQPDHDADGTVSAELDAIEAVHVDNVVNVFGRVRADLIARQSAA